MEKGRENWRPLKTRGTNTERYKERDTNSHILNKLNFSPFYLTCPVSDTYCYYIFIIKWTTFSISPVVLGVFISFISRNRLCNGDSLSHTLRSLLKAINSPDGLFVFVCAWVNVFILYVCIPLLTVSRVWPLCAHCFRASGMTAVTYMSESIKMHIQCQVWKEKCISF